MSSSFARLRLPAALALALALVLGLLAPLAFVTSAQAAPDPGQSESGTGGDDGGPPTEEPREQVAVRGIGMLTSVEDYGVISGLVYDRDGNLVDDVMVEAIPFEQPDADPLASALTYEYGNSESHGAYELEVPVGDYLVRFGSSYDDYWGNSGRQYETVYYGGGSGVKVTVTEDGIVLDPVTVTPDAGAPVTGVLNDSSGQPQPGVEVALIRATSSGYYGWYAVDWAVTDAQGRYTFPKVNRGHRYTVRAYTGWSYADEYLDDANTYLGSKPTFATADRVLVPSGSTGVTFPTFDLLPGSTVTGRLLDPEGFPLTDVSLDLMTTADSGGYEYFGYGYTAGEYDDGEPGTFTFYRVPRGLDLTFYAYDVRRYYGDVDDYEQADRFSVPAADASLDLGDITLTESGRPVTGRVVDPDGEPVESIRVYLGEYDEFDDEWYFIKSTRTGADGTYRLVAPFGGEYTVFTYDEVLGTDVYLGDTSDPSQAVRFTAQSGDAPYEAQDLTAQPYDSRISGVVLGTDGEPAAGARVTLYEDSFGEVYSYDSVTAGPDGRYRFPYVYPGETYLVAAQDAAGGPRIYAGDDGSTASVDQARRITVDPGQHVRNIDIALFDPPATVSGVVVTPGQEGVGLESDVTLYRWVDEDEWGDGGYWSAVDYEYLSGTQRRFAFTDLSDGDYYVAVTSYRYDDAGYSQPYLRTTSNGTTRPPTGPDDAGVASIVDGGSATLDVTMDAGVPITGTATLADSTTPLSGVWVTAYDPENYEFYESTRTRKDGTYTIRSPRNVSATVYAYRSGLTQSEPVVLEIDDAPVTQDFVLSPNWGAVGTVSGEQHDYCLQDSDYYAELTFQGRDLEIYDGRIMLADTWTNDPFGATNRTAALVPLTGSYSDASFGVSPDGDTLCVLWNDTQDPYVYEDGSTDTFYGNAYQALLTEGADGTLEVTYNYDRIDPSYVGSSARAGHTNGLTPFEQPVRFPDASTQGQDLASFTFDPETYEEVPNPRGLTSNRSGSDVDGRYVFDFAGFDLGERPVAATFPAITGTPALGETLAVTPGTWTVDGAAAPVQQIYRWRSGGRVVATGETYVVKQSDLGKRLRVQALAYVPGRELGSVYSGRVRVLGDPAATNTAPPSITGSAQAGSTLSADPGTWTPADGAEPSYAYQWLVDGDPVRRATGETYTTNDGQVGRDIAVQLTASAAGYRPVVATSAPLRVTARPSVANVVRPAITDVNGGDVKVGDELTATSGTWDVPDATFSYRWFVGGFERGRGTSYTVSSADLGSRIAVRVVASAPGYSDGSASSTSVGPVLQTEQRTAPLTGSVRTDSGTPVSGATWGACDYSTWSCLDGGTTGAPGTFSGQVEVGSTQYVYVYHPDFGSQSRQVTVGEDGVTVEFTFIVPTPPPANVSVPTSNGTYGSNGTPSVHYNDAQTFNITGCATTNPTWRVDFTNGAESLTGSLVKTGDLDGGLASYTASIPAFYPNTGLATVSFSVPATCGSTEPTKVLIYIDPSGVVTDQFGNPIVGATVTLQRSDTAGGQFTTVADGDESIMDPEAGLIDGEPGSGSRNPKPTDETGFFRWDVTEGWYRVRVEATGCTTLVSPEMQVAPPRVDLMLKMQCADAVGPDASASISGATGGVAKVGTVLTASGAPATAPFESRFFWTRNGAEIPGATGSTYTVRAADIGAELRAVQVVQHPDYVQEEGRGTTVTFTPSTGTSAPVTGAQGDAPTATSLPGLTGSGKVGTTLSVTDGTWNAGGLTFTRQWRRGGTPIAGQTGTTYQVTPADVGQAITVVVTATRAGYADGTATSNAVNGVLGDAATATAPPMLDRTAQVGVEVGSSLGAWNAEGLTFTRQWLRAGEPIPGATGATYLVTPDDLGQAISVRVTASRTGYADGTSTSLTSTALIGEAATATATPTVTGSGTIGATLTANPGTWSAEGLTFSYQWLRAGSTIPGQTGTTYRVTTADAGRPISVRVTASRTGYQSGAATSTAVTVARLASTTKVTAPKKAKAGKSVSVTIKVTAPGATPSGFVTVYDGTKRIASLKLTRGAAKVTIKKIKPGKHPLKAVYAGDGTVAGSTSKVVTVTVAKAKKPKKRG